MTEHDHIPDRGGDQEIAVSNAPVILVATVGGSPQPIRSAMAALRPAVVCFVVSDGTDGRPSSRAEVQTGPADGSAPLRDHPDCPSDFSIVEVPSDNPDRAMATCRASLKSLRQKYPDHRLVADYTGGTKSMTGALLMAALGMEGVDVQFMLGDRPDLVQVKAGTERPVVMSADYVLAERERASIDALIAVFDYGAALGMITRLDARVSGSAVISRGFKREVNAIKQVLSVVDAWDKFDFKEAESKCQAILAQGGIAAKCLSENGFDRALAPLADRRQKEITWPVVSDLWLNAQRCAARGRYDDAVARLYRLTEAVVQAQLWEKHRITNPPPWDKVSLHAPHLLQGVSEIRGTARLGLEKLREFLIALDPSDPVSTTFSQTFSQMKKWTQNRNQSILAHGLTPINETMWNTSKQWVSDNLRPFWSHCEMPQLPRKLVI